MEFRLVGVRLGALLVVPCLRLPPGDLGLRGLERVTAASLAVSGGCRVGEHGFGAAVIGARRGAVSACAVGGGLELNARCAVLSLCLCGCVGARFGRSEEHTSELQS